MLDKRQAWARAVFDVDRVRSSSFVFGIGLSTFACGSLFLKGNSLHLRDEAGDTRPLLVFFWTRQILLDTHCVLRRGPCSLLYYNTM